LEAHEEANDYGSGVEPAEEHGDRAGVVPQTVTAVADDAEVGAGAAADASRRASSTATTSSSEPCATSHGRGRDPARGFERVEVRECRTRRCDGSAGTLSGPDTPPRRLAVIENTRSRTPLASDAFARRDLDPLEAASRIPPRPWLVAHGSDDDVVAVEDARRLDRRRRRRRPPHRRATAVTVSARPPRDPMLLGWLDRRLPYHSLTRAPQVHLGSRTSSGEASSFAGET